MNVQMGIKQYRFKKCQITEMIIKDFREYHSSKEFISSGIFDEIKHWESRHDLEKH